MKVDLKTNTVDCLDDFYWYHCIDFGDGVVTDGDYDMSDYIEHFQFPVDMTGESALDVGRASGFFAFEFERRGANVTATEIKSILDWDFVAGGRERYLSGMRNGSIDFDRVNKRDIRGAFFYARDRLGSKVKDVTCTVYELDPSLFGGHKFDLVFAGSITSHLSDIVGGLKRLRSVTADDGTCIVSAPFLDIPEVRSIPTLSMIGTADPDRRSWWNVNATGLEELLKCAGFKHVAVVSHFTLENRRSPSKRIPHIVAHARPSASFVAIDLPTPPYFETRGLHDLEPYSGGLLRWTASEARLLVPNDPLNMPKVIELLAWPIRNDDMSISVDGKTIYSGPIPNGEASLKTKFSGFSPTIEIVLRVEPMRVPGDSRDLGIPLRKLMIT